MHQWIQDKVDQIFTIGRGRVISETEISQKPGDYPVFSSQTSNKGEFGRVNFYEFEGEYITWTTDGANAGTVFYRNGRFNCTNVCGTLKPKKKNINVKLFSYLIDREAFKHVAVVGNNKLMNNVMAKIKVNYPEDYSEQKAIAGILSKVDEAIEAVENSVKAADRLKKFFMQNLLTGKLKPDGTWRSEDEFYVDEKFGKVPKGWQIVKGSKITTRITKGQSPKWQGFDYQSSGILFVTSENVQDGYIDVSEPKYLPIEFHEKIKNSQLQNEDVLINIVGASIGRCAVYDLNQLANTNQAVCVFRTNDDNDSKFIAYYLQLEKTKRRLLGSQVETARANLSLGDFRKFKFIIPQTREEQLLIAKEIDEFISIIRSKRSKLQSLKTLKKSLMQNLLTGKVQVDVEKINKLLEEGGING